MNVYQHELDDGLGGADELDGVWGHPGATEAPQPAANERPASPQTRIEPRDSRQPQGQDCSHNP